MVLRGAEKKGDWVGEEQKGRDGGLTKVRKAYREYRQTSISKVMGGARKYFNKGWLLRGEKGR